jgi:hypothetical protein
LIQEGVDVKRPFFVIIFAILLTGLILFRLSDTTISIADTDIANNEVTSTISKAGNSSASALITITMTGVLDE